ncbi:MAG: 3'-5' exoribonuclease [Prevotella sp.]|jgi:DNA polymerase-3 subunit epsilon|nr:3'-5' exoribonuclease [Prevotella sp.]
METGSLLKGDFTALDFETMTPERTSACAIGLVRVEDNTIVQKFYSLIKPIPDDRKINNINVNGISNEMVENAPTFKELWPSIENFISEKFIVAHNTSFDLDVLQKVANYYNIPLEIMGSFDTMLIIHKSLNESCEMMGIDLEHHHDALCDATACAEMVLKSNGVIIYPTLNPVIKEENFTNKKISGETKQPLNPKDVENKDTPFFEKKVVLTGNLINFPNREEISEKLKSYGADINTSISKKTNIVIVGEKAGPSKMKKIKELKDQGYEIRIIEESELISIMNEFNIK